MCKNLELRIHFSPAPSWVGQEENTLGDFRRSENREIKRLLRLVKVEISSRIYAGQSFVGMGPMLSSGPVRGKRKS